MDEFLAEYGSVLRGLVRNEKAQINMLSMLAEDNRAFAEGIVRLIEQHILTCPPPAKLPALYLVDSIIKNVGDPYISKFSERLPEVFGAVWETTLQEKRASLSRLYGTWTGVLPAPVLARVQERMASPIGAATAQQRQQPPRAAQPQPALVPQVLQVQPQQHQQQQQQQQPILQMPAHMTFTVPVPTQLDAMRGPPPPPAARSSAGQQQQQGRKSGSPMPTSGQLTSDALSQLLSNLAGTGVLAKGGGGAAEDAAKVQKVKDFQPAFLKETHAGVLHLLEQLSVTSRAKFRDVEFQRNKRRSAAAGAGASRAWYLTVDTWIAGTLTTEDAVASNPFGDEAASDSEQGEEALEPEDPEQPCCAISGEPFDKFFDPDKEEWFYRGAKRIHGDEAQRYGVADGSLVKAKCLAEAGLGSGEAAMLVAGGGGQQQQEGDAEAAMAAAAAGAPAAGQAASEQQQQQQQHADGDQLQQQEGQPAAAAGAVVKEEVQDAADYKSEALQDSKMEDVAAAAQQQAGTKREASAEAAADDQPGELGSAAKRAKLEQAA
ncbi:hypothetical protein OEZ85_004125 [Tetradesmus obliquus]|uniref:CID domain-containing protein n=1 Tax=Tetradesmus obliquus TaxID=3088 RepID=A0ABY8UDR9_TETOB|nr:hypothetical protein OEZ85_004125 [Tetradesmus obliquus]